MENGDEWLARDKLYHFLFCFSIAFLFSTISSRSRYPFVRRRSILLGSLASIAAGAAKEAGDEVGIFRSAGASAKDAAADLLGTAIASLTLFICSRCSPRPIRAGTDDRGPSLV